MWTRGLVVAAGTRAYISGGTSRSRKETAWGRRYEVAFRDLYPWGNVCFCQQSIKYVNEAQVRRAFRCHARSEQAPRTPADVDAATCLVF